MMSEGPGSHRSPPLRREAASGTCEEPGLPRTQGPKAEVASAPSWGQSGPVSYAEQGRPGEGLASAARGPSSPGQGLPPAICHDLGGHQGFSSHL